MSHKLKTTAQIEEELRKASSTDPKDILARAQQNCQVPPNAKVNIAHLSKVSKNQHLFD